jgi:phenylalanyl-tRNA synthetase beta chain
MKVSLDWIRRYVDLPRNLDLTRLSHDLTMRTVEVEDAVNPADSLNSILVGVITDIQPHPQADMLKVCLVDIGENRTGTIVCGGSNIKVGLHVAVAVSGATVRWHGEGEPVLIKTTKVRGVKSDGMICAASEMQLEELFPGKADHEILDMTDFPAKVGTPVSQALGLDDIILEINNKSLTNRPDLWCHYGIARELAAIYRLPLKPLPVFNAPEGLMEFPVTIQDPSRCRRYAALQYESLDNAPSPYWLKMNLWKVGIRPISSLVDITNFVMLDVGQPTHAFDRNMVREEIIVRTARTGEKLTLLDGRELKLAEDDLMICDRSEPIALAGIMGGVKDSILPQTDNMLLEIANFEPRGVRRSATRYQVRTESANRNEKGLDTQRVEQAMAVANQLILQLYPEARMTAFTDRYPVETRCPVIQVSLDWLNIRLGRQITAKEAQNLLNPLGFSLEHQGQTFQVKVPTWRSTGDVSEKADVLEEIARMIGYEHFDFIPPAVRLEKAVNQPGIALERAAREYLAFQCGMQEIYTYPWVNQKVLDAAGFEPESCLQLAAPPSPDVASLRPSLVPAMLEAASLNLRYFEQFRVFELAQVFTPGQAHSGDPEETLPQQLRSLTAALVGKDPRLLFRQAKGILEQLPRAVMAETLSFAQVQKPAWTDAKAWLNILSGDQVIGALGLISSQAARAADIKRTQMAVFEINMDLVLPLPSRSNQFQHLPQFPLVEQDFSVLLDEAVNWADISEALEKSARKLEFVEEYRGKQIPDGKKSIMFKVAFGSDEGTLTSGQIEEKVNALKKNLMKLGGELRI